MPIQCIFYFRYVDNARDYYVDCASDYLSSAKGTQDINDMLDTFFNEKGKLIGMLQMFMTKESIADRISERTYTFNISS